MDQGLSDAAEQGSIDAFYQSFKAAEQRRTDVLCQSLRDVAEQGSIDALYALIRTNSDVLDRIDEIPFVDTPLHIAASLGHTQFAMEIMKLKPSFAKKLNQDGFSPMHLALQKHHDSQNDDALQRNLTILVHRLLDVDKDLVRVQGREGVTPLHYVVQIGNLKFLKKFSEVCHEYFEDVTIRRETALHIALKSDEVEAFKHLLERLRQAWFKDAKLLEEKVLYWEDEEGNTLLHVAVSKNKPEVVSSLMDTGLVDIEAKNLEGDTVFDILERQPQEDNQRRMRKMLKRQELRDSFFLSPLPGTHLILTIVDFFMSPKSGVKKCHVEIRRQQTALTDEKRNALLVVAALLITVIYPLPFSRDEQPNQFNYWTASINATDGANHNYHFNWTASINATDGANHNYHFNWTASINATDGANHNYHFNWTASINATDGANHNYHFNSTARFNATIVNNRSQANDDFFFYIIYTLTYYLTNLTLCFLLPSGLIGWVLYALLSILFLSYIYSSSLLSNSSRLTIIMVTELFFPLLAILPWLAAFTDKPVNNFSSSILK